MILSWGKECGKYLSVLIDSKLSWTHDITYISIKISKSISILAGLRHFVPSSTLLNIYCSLVQPYLSYGIAVWGQAAPTNLEKILILQKRALRLIHFKPFRFHAVPLFKLSYVLPLNFLYFKTICLIMHDVSNNVTPPNVSKLFTYSSKVHHHNTRFSAAGNFYNFFLFLPASISYRLLWGQGLIMVCIKSVFNKLELFKLELELKLE